MRVRVLGIGNRKCESSRVELDRARKSRLRIRNSVGAIQSRTFQRNTRVIVTYTIVESGQIKSLSSIGSIERRIVAFLIAFGVSGGNFEGGTDIAEFFSPVVAVRSVSSSVAPYDSRGKFAKSSRVLAAVRLRGSQRGLLLSFGHSGRLSDGISSVSKRDERLNET